MKVNSLVKGLSVGMVLGGWGLQAIAQEYLRPLSEGIVPLERISVPAAEGLGSPSSLDGSSILDVSVPSVYVPITPCRLVDTRQIGLAFGNAAGETLGFKGWAGDEGYADQGGFAGNCGIPKEATAIHMNYIIPGPNGSTGFLRSWPNNAPAPTATLLTWRPGGGLGNAATVPICSDGTESGGFSQCFNPTVPSQAVDFWVRIFSDIPENLVIDAFGYYEAP